MSVALVSVKPLSKGFGDLGVLGTRTGTVLSLLSLLYKGIGGTCGVSSKINGRT